MTASAELQAFAAAIAEAGVGGVSCRRNSGRGHRHLEMGSLRQLRFYQPGDLTVGCDAGMTVAELNAILAPHGQWVPIDVARPAATTLGAVLAEHRSGPLRQRFGTVRDFAIGMEMATAQGELVHCGGRVVKNVAGYDWAKLAIGSRGAIGIITGVNFRVFPQLGPTATGHFAQLAWPQVEALRSRLLHSPLRPLAIELWRAANEAPSVYVRSGGSEAVLARCRAELEALARAGKCEFAMVAEGAGEAELWRRVAEFPASGGSRVALPAAEAVAQMEALPAGVAISGRLGLGVYHVRGAAPAPAAVDAATAELMARLKRELDPDGRLHGDSCVG